MGMVEHLREELRLIYDALNPERGGVSSSQKFQKVRVEMEVHVAEGTYFPPSVEPNDDFKWTLFADSPHDADEAFNECRIYNIVNNAVTNIHGLSIGELKVATSGVGYTDEYEEGC